MVYFWYVNARAFRLAYVLMLCLIHHHEFGLGEDRKLMVGFYSQTCPKAESIVTSVVNEASKTDPRTPAMLLRLHFHDCFVQGCDGSVLITSNPEKDERDANGHQGLGGDEVIKRAKTLLEQKCQGVVSCADIVALSARDSVVLGGGKFYEVETGRMDGRISNKTLADEILPDVNDDLERLKSRFHSQGFDDKDLVVLSGAHSIGTTACFFMSQRLYDFNDTDATDPSINRNFLGKLMNNCPRGGDFGKRISIDDGSEAKFDNQIFRNIKNGFAVLSSDARLYDEDSTKQIVDSYVVNPSSFAVDFGVAMIKLGRLDVKLGPPAEIRRECNSINNN